MKAPLAPMRTAGQALATAMLTMPPYPYPTRRSRLRLLVERVVFLVIALLLLQTWYLEGLIVPCRIASGSMAETLLGPHRDVICGDCGHRFVCGTDLKPVPARAVCPNCGFAENDLGVPPDLAGDCLLICKSVFHLRPPGRWEVVAFRRSIRANKILVKRVVGLPDESIQIRGGDVYADGQIKRKTLRQQCAVAVLVHDADSRPLLSPVPPPRWQGQGEDTRWGSANGRFAHPATPEDEEFDVLEYRHWRREPGHDVRGRNDGGVRECPVTDQCGYNQTRPRRAEDVHPVADLLLSLRLVETWGQGWMNVTATDGREDFEVRVYPNRNGYEALHNGRQVPEGTGRLPPETNGLTLEISLFDRRLLLAFNGRPVLLYPYNPTLQRKWQPTSRPLAIGARGLGVLICDLRVYRDVYYTDPIGLCGPMGSGQTGEAGEESVLCARRQQPDFRGQPHLV